MINRTDFGKLAETDEAARFVGVPRYSQELPDSKNAVYLIERNSKGLWQVAVRGYNDGQSIPAMVSKDKGLAVVVDGKQHQTSIGNHAVMAIDEALAEEYAAALEEPEDTQKPRLLVQVLETGNQGAWGMSQLGAYNDPEYVGELTYVTPSLVGLKWQDTHEWDDAAHRFKHYPPYAAKVVTDGPAISVVPYEDGQHGMTLSSIDDRIEETATHVAARNPLTSDGILELYSV